MVKQIILGSTAAKHWFSDFRNPSDLDVVTSEPQTKEAGIDSHCHPLISKNWHVFMEHLSGEIATPDLLYTWKVSHSYWDVHWMKTVKDIMWLKERGCKIIPEVHSALIPVWEDVHGKKRVKLNVKNEAFFKKTVERKYEHDWLHEKMAFDEQPMYRTLKKNLDMAWIDYGMWDKLPHDKKIQTVLEEAYVIALERHVLPGHLKHLSAYRRALKELITRLSKGWFPMFIVDNLKEIAYRDLDSHFLYFGE